MNFRFTLLCFFVAACAATAATPDPAVQVKSGAWGDLEVRSTYLEAPEAFVEMVAKPNSTPFWKFPGTTEGAILDLFVRAGLPVAMQARLLDRKRLLNREGVITLFPAVDDIEALTPAQRAIVYTELGKSQLNEYQHDPVFIFGGDIDDWLREATLTDAQKSLVRKMAWRRGRALAFSDIPVLLSHAQSDAEVNGIFKLATRVRTLLAELKLPVGVNVKPLLEYWTAGRRMTDSVPLLKSVAQRDCITALDATHLLPPFARHRVYTYPTLDLATRGRMPDCHWTSLNFFNTEPQNYYLDTRLASSHIQEHYKAADGPFQFGDVLVLLDGKGESRHSCVYVAGDMVFTKNGENALMPWLLMWLDDVREIYQENADWPVQAYRLRRGN